jgi:uroporphyrinogen decarboxylase
VNARFLAACRRETVDATPVWFMRQAGRSLPSYRRVREHASLADIVADSALCAEVTLEPVRRLGVDAAILFADITTPLAGLGVDVALKDGVGPVIEVPIRTAADLARLREFDAQEAARPLLDAIRIVRAAADVPLIGFAGAPFTLASYLVEGRSDRDATRLKTLLYAEPEVGLRLLERLTDMTIAYVSAQVAAGVQAVQLFDSWVGALSPADYDRFVAPHMTRIFSAVATLGVPTIHFGTGTAALVERIAATGCDVIGLDWRVSVSEAWSRAPDKAVQGNLDPAVLLGPWAAVERETDRILTEPAGRPGHIFNLGHGVLPETDPDNLRQLVDVVHDRGAATRSDPRRDLALAGSPA